MKFTREQAGNLTIRRVEAGSIKVGDKVLKKSFALTPHEIIQEWPACEVATLCEQDFQPLFDVGPEMILLGTGDAPVFPPRELVFALARRGIGLETMDTAAACRTFNILVADGRMVAAVLIL